MGRIRSLKPEFGHSEKLSAEHSEVHLLAALLLTYADDEGYFNANPKLVQAACCPLRELFMSIPEILVRLTAVGYIEMLPGAQGRTYARVINFFTHQRVAHPTASKIKLLLSPPENFVKPPDTFSPDLGTGNREQGRDVSPFPSEISSIQAARMFLIHDDVCIPSSDFELRDSRAGIEAIMTQEKLTCQGALDWAVKRYILAKSTGKKTGPGWMRRAGYNDAVPKKPIPMVNAYDLKMAEARAAQTEGGN